MVFAMDTYKIENLAELLTEHLQPDVKILETTVTKLPQGGYGGIMLQIDLKLKYKNEEESKHLVGKILPASEEIRKLFNIQVTYKKEVTFYTTILPTLRHFQEENGIPDRLDFFPKFYAARLNLDGADKVVTDDAVLVLENLIKLGYQNLKPGESFDLDTSREILSNLAKFHGVTICFKQKNPKTFDDVIKANLSFDYNPKELKKWAKGIGDIIVENPQCAPYTDIVLSCFDKKPTEVREPYATIAHCDLWINNIMTKTENGRSKNIFIDFQLMAYRSAASDVFFFLWTSVDRSVLEKHLDELIAFYHDQLVGTLREFQADTTGFSLEKFYEELKIEADFEFGHAFLFVYGTKNPTISVTNSEHNKEVLSKGEMLKGVPSSLKELLWFMIIECSRRGWVY